MKKVISSTVVLYILWIALAGIQLWELLIGLVVSVLISLLTYRFNIYNIGIRKVFSVFKFIVLYIPLFIYKLILANIQIAKIVLSPSLPIDPGFVRIKTGLDSDLGKLILANSITLTPGTLTLDVQQDELLIHWVVVKGDSTNDHFKEIAHDFEKTLGGIIS